MGEICEVSLLAEELLASSWQRLQSETPRSSRMWLLRGHLHSGWWTRPHVIQAELHWLSELKQKRIWSWEENVVRGEEKWEEGEWGGFDQNTWYACTKFSNKKIYKKYFLPRQSDAILKEVAKFPSQLKQFFRQPSHLHTAETIPILSN